jgi:hypothetical protein
MSVGAGASSAAGSELLAYEQLSGIASPRVPEHLEWLRIHPRAPGFWTLVPHGCPAQLGACDGVAVEDVAAGRLLRVAVTEDFTLSEVAREAMERALLPCFGSPRDAQALEERLRA